MSEEKSSQAASNRNTILRILLITGIYFLLRYMGGTIGATLLYPIQLLVTFLHEFGHGAAAYLSGGGVQGLQINTDGSGHCLTVGGNVASILVGGYVGSAIFGNILFYIGAKLPWMQRIALAGLGFLMLFVAIFWFESIITSIILIAFAVLLYFLAQRSNWPGEALMFFGIASILYIIEDSHVGPSSDLERYAAEVGIFGQTGWTNFWLAIVVGLSIFNLYLIFTRKPIAKLVNRMVGK